MVALVDRSPVRRRGRDRETHLGRSALETARDVEACVLEHPQHRRVVRHHLGDEGGNPCHRRRLGELLEQPGPDPLALELVGDGERDLGAGVVSKPNEVRQRDDPLRLAVLGQSAHKRPALVPVGLDERLDRGRGERGKAVEAPVDAALGQTAEELDQSVHVRLVRRAQPQRAAVAQNDITHLEGAAAIQHSVDAGGRWRHPGAPLSRLRQIPDSACPGRPVGRDGRREQCRRPPSAAVLLRLLE